MAGFHPAAGRAHANGGGGVNNQHEKTNEYDDDEVESEFSDWDQPYHETASNWYHRHARRRARRLAGISSSSSSSSSEDCSSLESGDDDNVVENGNDDDGGHRARFKRRKEMEKAVRSANRPLAKWLASYPLMAARCCLSSVPSKMHTMATNANDNFGKSQLDKYGSSLPPRDRETKQLRRKLTPSLFPHGHITHKIRGGAFENEDDDGDDEGRETTTSTSQDTSRTMYNKQATNWVRTEPRCLSDFTGRPVVFGMLEEELGKDNTDKIVLDVGCGEGYCARKVVELGAAKVVGSDISQEMINSAKITSEGDDRFRYYVCPVGELVQGLNEHVDDIGIESPEGGFDLAMAVFLFNYLTTNDMEDAIVQVYQALKPGGNFVFSVPHPSMIFCHDKGAVFRLNSEGEGYYSSRNKKILGQISTIDGTKLNIMSVHKTIGDYINAINAAGFQIVDIQEAGVTDEHLALHPEFFSSVQDRPLHLVFKLKKP